MTNLLKIRELGRMLYGRYSVWIDMLLRFLGVLITLLVLKAQLGYFSLTGNILVILLLSVMASVLPVGFRSLIVAACVLVNLYAVSYEALGAVAVALLLMLVTYYIFQPGDSELLYLVPVLFVFKLPYVIPILVGLAGSVMMAVPVAFGIVLYYLLKWVVDNASLLSSSSALTSIQKLSQLLDDMSQNNEMFVFMVAFAATIFVVYTIRRLSIRYSWAIAIFAGTLVNLLVLVMGALFLEIKLNVLLLFLGLMVGAVVGLILELFVFMVDYSRVVETQFEDDDYYYYVKAVPKFSLSTEKIESKQILSREKREERTPRPARRRPERRPAAEAASAQREEEELRNTLRQEMEETQSMVRREASRLMDGEETATRADGKEAGAPVRRRRTEAEREELRRRREQEASGAPVRRKRTEEELAELRRRRAQAGEGRELTEEEKARRRAARARRRAQEEENRRQ